MAEQGGEYMLGGQRRLPKLPLVLEMKVASSCRGPLGADVSRPSHAGLASPVVRTVWTPLLGGLILVYGEGMFHTGHPSPMSHPPPLP